MKVHGIQQTCYHDDQPHCTECVCPPYSTDRILVRLEHFHIVHIRLPVFDKACVISCDHPGIVVAPLHRPDCGVVGLKTHKSFPYY